MSEVRSAVLLLLLLLELLPAGHQTRPVPGRGRLRVLELPVLPVAALKCLEVPLLHQLVEELLTILPMLTLRERFPLAWLPR